MSLASILSDPGKVAAFTIPEGDRQQVQLLELYYRLMPYIAADFRMKTDDFIEKQAILGEMRSNFAALNTAISTHVHSVPVVPPVVSAPSGQAAPVLTAYQPQYDNLSFQGFVAIIPPTPNPTIKTIRTPTGAEVPVGTTPLVQRLPFTIITSEIAALTPIITMAKILNVQPFDLSIIPL